MSKTLESALPIYANLLCEQVGVKLGIGGSKAYAEVGRIQLPDLPLDNEEAGVKAYGYIMHESGHLDDTDMNIWPQDKLLAKVANWFEDIRVEKGRIKKYPGARKRLYDLISTLVKTGEFAEPQASHPPSALLSAVVLYRLRASVLGQDRLSAYAESAEKLASEVFPPSMISRLNSMIYLVEDCTSTQDVIDLAKSVVDMFKEEEQEDESNPQPQQGQSNDKADTDLR